MAKISVRYFLRRPRGDGTDRFYWQPDTALRAAGWKSRRLPDDQAQALQEAEKINQAVDAWRAGKIDGPVNDAPGSVDALIVAYKKSADFRNLSERTQTDYTLYLKAISSWAGGEAAASIRADAVQALYEILKEKSERKAMYLVQVLRLLFNFAERKNLTPKGSNPAAQPDITYRPKKGKLWSPAAVAHFVKTADELGHFTIGTAVMINEWLGQRRGDLLALRMSAYRDGTLHITQSKTDAEVELPIDEVPALKARLALQIERNRAAAPKGTALLQTRNGKPYTADGFMSLFEIVRVEAAKEMPEISKLVFMNLRHTAVTRLGEAGCTLQEIASITGHKLKTCEGILDTYNIRTAKMARQAFRRRHESTTNEGEK